MYYYYTEQT